MSPIWFLVGVVLFCFQAVDGAVQQPSVRNPLQYYCPADFVVNYLVPQDGPSCQINEDCKSNEICCTAVITDDTVYRKPIKTYNRCVTPQKKSKLGFCPKVSLPDDIVASNISCEKNIDCKKYNQICCHLGYKGIKVCMTPQNDPPTKFPGEWCSARPNDKGNCLTSFQCFGTEVCCGNFCVG